MRSSFIVLGIAVATCASVARAEDTAGAPAAEGPPGHATYVRLCKSCHGDDGRGNATKAAALKIEAGVLDLARPEAAALTRDERRKVLLEGKGKMPAYAKKLKPEEIDPLLDYSTALIKTE